MPFSALIRRSSSKAGQGRDAQQPSQDARNRTAFLKRFRKRYSQNHEEPSAGAGNLKTPCSQTSEIGPPSTFSIQSTKPRSDRHRELTLHALSLRDVRFLFYGAPHFIVEKGRHGRSYPQIIFPWNTQLEIADLWDRRPLRHESFELATLHAHLPIPDEYAAIHGSSKPIQREVCWKGATFEVGVFEVPNMLGSEGREIGTVGFRHFMELPVADAFRREHGAHVHDHSTKVASPRPFFDISRWTSHNNSLARSQKPELDAGPSSTPPRDLHAWRSLNIRALSFQKIAKRLEEISRLHDIVVTNRQRLSILSINDTEVLREQLFTDILYSPSEDSTTGGTSGLAAQIEALIKTLAKPGVWLDLSLPRYRMEPGRIIWSPPSNGNIEHTETIDLEAEKKCFYVQILLAVELLLRLDAVMKGDIARTAGEQTNFSADDIRHFNHIRNRKTDFDLVLARRFLNYFKVQSSTREDQLDVDGTDSDGKNATDAQGNVHSAHPDISTDLILIPRRAAMQLDGLMKFACEMKWSRVEELRLTLTQKFHKKLTPEIASSHRPLWPNSDVSLRESQITPNTSRSTVSAHTITYRSPQCKSDPSDEQQSGQGHKIALQAATSTSMGSWLSQSWLSGLVLPGDSISCLLMAALLENDVDQALLELGEAVSLSGGFILGGRSWWSKASVISRVLGSLNGAAECMGWVTAMIPFLDNGDPCPNGWFDVKTEAAPLKLTNPRLFDGPKVSRESSPLGMGQGTIRSTEFKLPLWTPYSGVQDEHIAFVNFGLHQPPSAQNGRCSASAEFSVSHGGADPGKAERYSFDLQYDVHFVSSQPCRLPHARILRPGENGSGHGQLEYLPAHPLHESFRYRIVTIKQLLACRQGENRVFKEGEETIVIDARGSHGKDALARAWCAETGHHGLVSREGRTCVSCSIREARALGVNMVIRIGACHLPSSRQSTCTQP